MRLRVGPHARPHRKSYGDQRCRFRSESARRAQPQMRRVLPPDLPIPQYANFNLLCKRYLGLANRSVSNTKTPIGTKSSCGKSSTEATDLSGSKIISTILAVAAQQGFILSRELLHCWANSAFACAEIHTRRQCQCRKSHTPDASRTRTVAPEYQYVLVRRAYPVGPQAGHRGCLSE
jgi:hypothetical protein